jgi:probable F420-dependent oxidoreductase
MPRPFRFGVLCEEMGTAEAWITRARRVEELGYATLLLRDHFMPGHFPDQFAPIAGLTAAAMLTTRLRVGSMVFDTDYRHPVLLAKEAATLDVLSGGRFEFGLGAGWMDSEYEQAGMPFDPPGTRISRFEEALHIFKGLFAEGPLTFRGKHYTIREIDGFPKPVQRPHPPILIGAGGQRMLGIAGREADIVGILAGPLNAGEPTVRDPEAFTPERFAEKIARLEAAAGERFSQLELSVITSPVFTNDRRQGAAQVAQARGWSGVTAEEVLEMPTIFVGSEDQIAEQMLERRERFGLSYYMVTDQMMEAVAPLAQRLTGN